MGLDLKNSEKKFCHIKQQLLGGIHIPEFKHRIGVMLIEF